MSWLNSKPGSFSLPPYHPFGKKTVLHLSWCVTSILAQNGSRASPKWVIHIGGDWGDSPHPHLISTPSVRKHHINATIFPKKLTCVSGSSDPMLAAPSFTTSVSWVMVFAEDWAAWASFSWLDAAPDTSIFVSSTRALAVFRMFSLQEGEPWWNPSLNTGLNWQSSSN